jgi:hypothetical protein
VPVVVSPSRGKQRLEAVECAHERLWIFVLFVPRTGVRIASGCGHFRTPSVGTALRRGDQDTLLSGTLQIKNFALAKTAICWPERLSASGAGTPGGELACFRVVCP